MQLGSDIEDSVIEERMKQQRADQCVSVVFSVSSLRLVLWSAAHLKHKCKEKKQNRMSSTNHYTTVQYKACYSVYLSTFLSSCVFQVSC